MEPASATPNPGMVMFDVLPALRALGQQRLQQLCDEWLGTDDAARLGVARLTVGDEDSGFALFPESSRDIPRRLDERLYQFTSSLLGYLATRGLPPEQQGLADRIATLITRPPGMMAPPPSPARQHAGFMASKSAEPPASRFGHGRFPMLAAAAQAERDARPVPVFEPPTFAQPADAPPAASDARQ